MALPSFSVQQSFKQARTVYLLLAALLLIAAVFIGIRKGTDLIVMANAVKTNATRVAELQQERDTAQKAYTDAQAAYAQDIANFTRTAEKVLPTGERYTELTRTLDDYFAKNYDPGNPIVASGLRFGRGQQVPGSQFYELPVNLTITSSTENFYKFLKFVEQSGSIETGVRIMDIQGIRVNFNKDNVSFTIDLRAFYRPSNGNDTNTSGAPSTTNAG